MGIICGVLTPYMLNPGAWNWGNYTGFFWVRLSFYPLFKRITHISLQGGICFCCIIYVYFRLPEPMGRSFAELDLLFERGVSARNFAKTDVDVFGENIDSTVINNYEEKLEAHHSESIVH